MSALARQQGYVFHTLCLDSLQPLGKCSLHFLSEGLEEPFHTTVSMKRMLHGKEVLTMAAVGFEPTPPKRLEP